MKKQVLFFIAVCLFLSVSIKAQETEQKARGIIEKAKKVIFKQAVEIKNIYLEFGADYRTPKEKIGKGYVVGYKYQSKMWLEYPDKIKLKTLIDYPDNSQQLSELTLNAQNLSNRIKVKSNGEGFVELTRQKQGDPQKIKEQDILKLKYTAFSTAFPIFLKFDDKLKFNFAGVAKAGEQKADVIETTLADSSKIKLFFDQKTRLLLMMTSQFFDEQLKSQVEQKFFYSDYREEGGLLFAHKIVIQENGAVVEERQIKVIMLNQSLKPDFFDVKN